MVELAGTAGSDLNATWRVWELAGKMGVTRRISVERERRSSGREEGWREEGWREDDWREDDWREDGWREDGWREDDWREDDWREDDWREEKKRNDHSIKPAKTPSKSGSEVFFNTTRTVDSASFPAGRETSFSTTQVKIVRKSVTRSSEKAEHE